MSIELVTGRVWPRLNGARRNARQRAWVAVAYFGKGAAKLLPLLSGSRLVVDASDNAVKTGQTHPEDLLELQAKGVRVFKCPHLHSKVYVFGRTAAIGSANASSNSAQTLREAVVLTTDRRIVQDAKAFVEEIAKNELGLRNCHACRRCTGRQSSRFPARVRSAVGKNLRGRRPYPTFASCI